MASFFISKTVLQNKENRFRAVITQHGRNIKSKTFRRKTDAKVWGSRLVIQLEEHEATGNQPCNVTFNQLCCEYLADWTGKDTHRIRLVSWWNGHFKYLLLSDITPQHIRDILKLKKSSSPATRNRYKAGISALLKFAIRQAQDDENQNVYITKNPCDEIQTLTENNQRVRFLSDEEKSRLLKSAKAIGGKFYLKVLMALTTGMRKGELEQLRWLDIDFDRGLAILHDTKNGLARHSPIPDVIMDLIKEHREVGNGLLFPSEIVPDTPFDYRKQWARCLKDANITDFRWHDMRHDVASTLARDGRTLKEIGDILGHKSLASTNRYAHLSTEHKSAVLNDTMAKSLGGSL